MAYATQADLEARYGEAYLATIAPPGDAAETARAVALALADAAAMIDALLAPRYPLPLSQPPAILTALSVDIALYRLAQTWDRLTDEARRRYEDALHLLKAIAEGKAGLPESAAAPTAAAEPGLGDVALVAGPRHFTRDSLADW